MSFFTATDTGPTYMGPGDIYTFLATGAETDGAYFVMEGLVPPGGGLQDLVYRGAMPPYFS